MATERAENVLKKQIADSDLHFYFHPVLLLRVSFSIYALNFKNFLKTTQRAIVNFYGRSCDLEQ
jgi:hypothetical protein